MVDVHVNVRLGDALAEAGDVLVLKHAQGVFGLDARVVDILRSAGIKFQLPEPSESCFVDSVREISALRLLFVGVPPLNQFDYREIRAFSRKAMSTLAEEAPQTRHILLTIHGPGYGLDEIEAFTAEVAGLVDAVRENEVPDALKRVTFVENESGRAKRLANALSRLIPDGSIFKSSSGDRLTVRSDSEELRSAGDTSDSKPHVFVAMPFRAEMDDIYHYGIQGAVNAAGYLCERADQQQFTGDILEWVKKRISTAALVIADLSAANANVYLEVGYAWGCNRTTVLLVGDASDLKFDVAGQRCIVYKNIRSLEQAITKVLAVISSTSKEKPARSQR